MKHGKRLLACSLALLISLQSVTPVFATDEAVEEQVYEVQQQEVIELPEALEVGLPAENLMEILNPEIGEATLIVSVDKDTCTVGEKVTFQVQLLETAVEESTYTGTLFLNGEEVCQIEQTEDVFSYTPEQEGQLMLMLSAAVP